MVTAFPSTRTSGANDFIVSKGCYLGFLDTVLFVWFFSTWITPVTKKVVNDDANKRMADRLYFSDSFHVCRALVLSHHLVRAVFV